MSTTTLTQFATPLAALNQFVKACWSGFAGSGKTKTSSDFVIGCYHDTHITKPLLMIDNEKGSRFLVPKFKAAGINVYVKDTTSLADVQTAMKMLNAGEIGFLYIDTLTKVWYQYVRDYREANRRKFMALDDWGKILPAWQEEFADRFVACDGNIVFTGRGGFSYEKEEDTVDEDGKVTKKGSFVKSGVKMKVAGETPFEPDLNVWMELEQEMKKGKLIQYRTAQVLKDRNDSPTSIDGKIFKNPTYKQFQPFVKFLMGVETGAVAGPSDTTNLAPSDDFGWYQRKQEREIETEKIKAVFDKMELGSSNKDKALKVVICEKLFGSSSGTEIEKMDAERLRFGRLNLEKLAVVLKKVQPEERQTAVESFDVDADVDLPFPTTKKKNGEATKEQLAEVK